MSKPCLGRQSNFYHSDTRGIVYLQQFKLISSFGSSGSAPFLKCKMLFLELKEKKMKAIF